MRLSRQQKKQFMKKIFLFTMLLGACLMARAQEFDFSQYGNSISSAEVINANVVLNPYKSDGTYIPSFYSPFAPTSSLAGASITDQGKVVFWTQDVCTYYSEPTVLALNPENITSELDFTLAGYGVFGGSWDEEVGDYYEYYYPVFVADYIPSFSGRLGVDMSIWNYDGSGGFVSFEMVFN